MIKYFRFDYDYVLWGISYQNLALLLGTIPSVSSKETTASKESGEGKVEDFADLGTFLNMK